MEILDKILIKIFKRDWISIREAAARENMELSHARNTVKRKGLPHELRNVNITIRTKQLFVDPDEFMKAVRNLPSRRKKPQ